jgi:hypothetical protein
MTWYFYFSYGHVLWPCDYYSVDIKGLYALKLRLLISKFIGRLEVALNFYS